MLCVPLSILVCVYQWINKHLSASLLCIPNSERQKERSPFLLVGWRQEFPLSLCSTSSLVPPSSPPPPTPPPLHHDTAGLREVASHPEQVPLRWGFELMPIKGEKDSFSHNHGFSSQAHMHDHQYFELKCLRRLLASQSHCWSCDQSSEGYWSWRMDLVIAPYRQTYGDVLNRSKSADPRIKISECYCLTLQSGNGLVCCAYGKKKNWLWVFTRKVLIIWRFWKPDFKSKSY